MATGLMTVTTAEKHIGEVWPQDVIRAEEFALEIAPRVYRKWKFAGFGDVYHIPRVPNIEAETKSASTDVTMRTYTDTEQTVTVNIHQAAGFEQEDIVALLSNTDLAMEMKRKIGYALGRALDVQLATYPQNFSQIYGSYSSELTYDNFISAWLDLTRAGVNVASNCTWFLSAAAKAGLLKQEIFINQLYNSNGGGRAVEQATIGNIFGAPVIVSNLTRAAAANQSDSWLQDQRAIGLIMAQEPKVVTEYIAKSLANVVVGHQVYGAAEIDRYGEAAGNVTATDTWAVLLKTVS